MKLNERPAFRIERLTPSSSADFLRFFDHESGPAFADNPEWAKCYCHYYEVPVAISWPTFDGAANRAAMGERIASGEMEGFLAYADRGPAAASGDKSGAQLGAQLGAQVVGWLNAQPYHKLQHACARLSIAAPPLPVPAHDAAAIVCFVTAPAWRRRGVARALLDGALANFAARGITLVDAFPWNVGPDDTAATDHYHGSPSLFAAAGFVAIATHDNVTVVRRMLR
ncbi:MAG: GNAT family N-acetyltransferase [Betaproteobacteria bacterium]